MHYRDKPILCPREGVTIGREKGVTVGRELTGKLSVALLKEFERANDVRAMCEEVLRQNRDAHLLFVQLGEKLGLVPESTVMGAFCTIWAQAYADQADSTVGPIRNAVAAAATADAGAGAGASS